MRFHIGSPRNFEEHYQNEALPYEKEKEEQENDI